MMKLEPGPTHDEVDAFLKTLALLPWFTTLGSPTDQDDDLVRVGLDDVLALYPDHYQLWGSSLLAKEEEIDHLVLNSGRLSADVAMQTLIELPDGTLDDFYVELTRLHPGYYGDSTIFAYEMIEPPLRLIRYAGRERLIRDVAPELRFFGDLMTWFGRGHWPVGWRGSWPEGRLILW